MTTTYTTKDLGFDVGLLHEQCDQPLEYTLQDLNHIQIRLTTLRKGRYQNQVSEAMEAITATLSSIEQNPDNALYLIQKAAESLVMTVNRMSPNIIQHGTARQLIIKRVGQQLSAGKF